MKNLKKVIETNKKSVLTLTVIMLGLLISIGAVLIVQTYRTRAEGATAIPLFIRTERSSSTVGKVQFETNIATTATLECSAKKNGDYILCGSDLEPSSSHNISTGDSELLLNPSTGYYVKIKIGQSVTLAYIAAHEQGATFGLDYNSFDTSGVGACRSDEDFDPAFDFNQDGCVNLHDAVEVID